MDKHIQILDCTLRDGGYVNHWKFGEKRIKKIINNLSQAHVDIIECGFLKPQKKDSEQSLYETVEEIKAYLPTSSDNAEFVAMVNCGEYDIAKLTPYDGSSLSGIRVVFHAKDFEKALLISKAIMNKGYKAYFQPMGTILYTDAELLTLIEKANVIKPYAFYIVDTLGSMYKNDLLRMFHLVDHNLNKEIAIGFHSHNNLQLSFSNAMHLMNLHTTREIIIDSSVYGMGRGAGNLNTELITHYINTNIGPRYDVIPLLEIIDDIIMPIYKDTPWGYSAPYYLAAVRNCHPNYASFLLNKQTLTIPAIGHILDKLSLQEKSQFDQNLIEKLYLEYQQHYIDDRLVINELATITQNKSVMLIAPGTTISTHEANIITTIDNENPIVISVNFLSTKIKPNFLFVSNLKRFESMDNLLNSPPCPIYLTSNLAVDAPSPQCSILNYESLLSEDTETDNSGLMALSLMQKIGVKQVYLAGFDGFKENSNYYKKELSYYIDNNVLQKRNDNIRASLHAFQGKLSIKFVTPSIYEDNGEA